MKKFMDNSFLLESNFSQKLFDDFAKKMPIVDFHNHLSAKMIYEDDTFENISKLWLGADHYKWRVMRALGIDEKYITGDATDYEKFEKFAQIMPQVMGNPIFSWSHLELRRYFDVDLIINKENSKKIYELVNEKLKNKQYSVRNLLRKMNVEILCTTDDPIDDLKYHKALSDENFEIKVLPTFRPEKAMNIESENFAYYIQKLGEVTNKKITNIKQLLDSLNDRIEYFSKAGCVVSDHSLGKDIFSCDDYSLADNVLKKALKKEKLTSEECRIYKGYILLSLAKKYKKENWVMQLHIGAIRNNSTRMFEKLGADTGYDSIDDFSFIEQLSKLLDSADKTDELPKTILYCLNGKDNEALAALTGNFQNSYALGKIQFGAAWWFLDQKRGINNQFDVLSNIGIISTFVGMVTDSRSFLSFPRHEYFRRLLCNYLGNLVETGQYPNDIDTVGKIVENICYYNSKKYFGFDKDNKNQSGC